MSEKYRRINLDLLHEALKTRLPEYISVVLPNAKKQSKGYRVGDIQGNKGDSLWIGDEGFKDHATGEHGSLIRLASTVWNTTIPEAARQLCTKLAINAESDITQNEVPAVRKIIELTDEHKSVIEARNLDVELAIKLGLKSTQDGAIAFPLTDMDGRQVGIKYRSGTQWSAERGSANVLWPLNYVQEAFADSDIIYITEGHWDAIAGLQAGFPCVSIPNGCTNTQWMDTCFNFIHSFSTIVLCYDNDTAGISGLKLATGRLSKGVKIINYPEATKDANDILTKYGINTLKEVLADPRNFEPENVINSVRLLEEAEEADVFEFEHDSIFGHDFPFKYRPHEYTVYTAYTGHGKALALDTLIQTPTGLRRIADIQVGDKVIHPSGNSVKVIATSEVFTDHDCFELEFDCGERVIADAGHLWLTDTHQSRASAQRSKKRGPLKKQGSRQEHKRVIAKVRTTAELYATQYGYDGRTEHSVSLAQPYEGFTEPHLMPPYTMGAWLGDGTSSCGGMTCHPDDAAIIQRIEREGYVTRKRASTYGWGILGLRVVLRKQGLLDNKHIPEAVFRASSEYRLSVLQGLMDTDGTVNNGQCEFCSVKKPLADGVLRLTCSLGIKARMYQGMATLNGREIGIKYRVMFTTEVPVFSLKRKLDKMLPTNSRTQSHFIISIRTAPKVPVKCIKVEAEDGLFVITKSCITTHNSNIIRQSILGFATEDDSGSFIASFEDTPKGITRELVRHMGKGMPRDEVKRILKLIDLYDTTQLTKRKKAAKVSPTELLALFEMQYKRYGTRHFVVDNMMTLAIDRSDLSAQSDAADQFRQFVISFPVHLHLVAHPRKQPAQLKSLEPPDPHDIRGASEIADLSWNILGHVRNIKKEREIDQMKMRNESVEAINLYRANQPDAVVHINKQRTTGQLPTSWLWFDQATKTYRTTP